MWAEHEHGEQLARDSTDSSLVSFSSSEGSFTLTKGDEQNLDCWQQKLTRDHRRSTASVSSLTSTLSTLIADDSETDHSACVAEQPSAEAGM